MDIQANWYETFFDGVAVDLWLQAVSAEQTERDVDRLVGASADVARGFSPALGGLLAVSPGVEVLDAPCGGGRLSLSLARRGYRMTGVDSSASFLAHARAADDERAVQWEQRDMRDLPWAGRFAGAFCVGNSFGYMDDEGNAQFLRAVRSALVPGGRFVLETPMVLENLLGHLQARPWWQVGDARLLVQNEYDASRSRLDIEYTFVRDGQVDVRRGTHRAYPFRELSDLMQEAGFAVDIAEPWSRDAHMATFIGTAV